MNDRRYLSGEVEVSEVPTIPANVYIATLDGVEETDHELYGSRWVWHWLIPAMHPDGGDFELQVWSPPRFSSTGIASEMARALGYATVKGAKVDLGSLRGCQAQLTVILDEEKGRNRVKAVTPAPQAPVAAASASQPQELASKLDPEYLDFLVAKRAAEKAAVAAANAEDPPAPTQPPADLADAGLEAA